MVLCRSELFHIFSFVVQSVFTLSRKLAEKRVWIFVHSRISGGTSEG